MKYLGEQWNEQLAAQNAQWQQSTEWLGMWENRVADFAADLIRFRACIKPVWRVLFEMVLL